MGVAATACAMCSIEGQIANTGPHGHVGDYEESPPCPAAHNGSRTGGCRSGCHAGARSSNAGLCLCNFP